MRLIGMLDSPYVRRVAVSMHLMGLTYTHEPVSVFRQFEHFASLNPVVKAPSLITAQGVVLMESTLILDYLDRLAEPSLRLAPEDLDQFLHAQRVIGLALMACEKSVQIVYELRLRPEDKQHAPWLDRVKGQLAAAYALLEAELPSNGGWLYGARPLQADVTAAVAWRFTQFVEAEAVVTTPTPRLRSLSERAEALAAFAACPLEGAAARA